MEKAKQFLEDECGKRRIKRVLEESTNAASHKELSETTAHLKKAQERKRKIKGLKGNEKSHKKRKLPMDSKDLENRSTKKAKKERQPRSLLAVVNQRTYRRRNKIDRSDELLIEVTDTEEDTRNDPNDESYYNNDYPEGDSQEEERELENCYGLSYRLDKEHLCACSKENDHELTAFVSP